MCNIFGNLTYGVILRNNPSEPCYVPIELAVHDQKICELCAIFVESPTVSILKISVLAEHIPN
jgi:hypothetical protein